MSKKEKKKFMFQGIDTTQGMFVWPSFHRKGKKKWDTFLQRKISIIFCELLSVRKRLKNKLNFLIPQAGRWFFIFNLAEKWKSAGSIFLGCYTSWMRRLIVLTSTIEVRSRVLSSDKKVYKIMEKMVKQKKSIAHILLQHGYCLLLVRFWNYLTVGILFHWHMMHLKHSAVQHFFLICLSNL